MDRYIYTSSIIEIKKERIHQFNTISAELSILASNQDLSLIILEQMYDFIICFTYSSPEELSYEAYLYLEDRFDSLVKKVCSAMKEHNIVFT